MVVSDKIGDFLQQFGIPRPNIALLVSLGVVFGAQQLVPAYRDNYKNWYPKLKKPRWTPPNWMFPAVWIPLKCMQVAALWLVWEKSPGPIIGPDGQLDTAVLPLAIFLIHLALGDIWNVSFFGHRQMKPSLAWMAAFWLSIAGCIITFRPISTLASNLMLPTITWVCIAAKLNWDIVALNAKRM
ncbi:hypothetical protein WJX84_004854 [Apatococcus fuscideae]|uniref:TspO/MBR-related protein n=1 Tax=Apatococcus fuscideae TaxID=2026836 RepID=A0AAW1T3J5_9CHLO